MDQDLDETPVQVASVSDHTPRYLFRWRQLCRGGWRWKFVKITLIRHDQVNEVVRLIRDARIRPRRR